MIPSSGSIPAAPEVMFGPAPPQQFDPRLTVRTSVVKTSAVMTCSPLSRPVGGRRYQPNDLDTLTPRGETLTATVLSSATSEYTVASNVPQNIRVVPAQMYLVP